MKVKCFNKGEISEIATDQFFVPFAPENYGFFVQKDEIHYAVELQEEQGSFWGILENLHFKLDYESCEDFLKINVEIENQGTDFDGRIGFHMGVDTYMVGYPEWHDKFFPTLLRCEKTHLWGYYMNTKENALAVATAEPIASYDILYNMTEDSSASQELHCGHRIMGTDILFYQNTILPERHPEHLKIMRNGEVYNNTIYLIPVEKKADIKAKISEIAKIPIVEAKKYTKEYGECLEGNVIYNGSVTQTLIAPDGSVCQELTAPMEQYGLYVLKVEADNGKQCEACFFVRRNWEYYLKHAAFNALSKPPKASTHVESFYGLFSAFLYYKHTKDEEYGKKAYKAFEEIMPYMFDMEKCVPITIPYRIQNTAGFISLLVDMYEVDPVNNLHYLEMASRFAEVVMSVQDISGAYRRRGVHYTCVIYIAKSMLELALAERECGVVSLENKSNIHYESVRRAIDELVKNLDNIETEGEMTLEDGMLICSSLQIAMFALTLPETERDPYIKAAEYMNQLHSCLEQQLIPDCRCNGASLRFWESQYDVMIRVNMFNSPHGWTAWTGYAKYYLYLLTGKIEYLLELQNLLGSCAQLIDDNGNLHWGYCCQPYVKGRYFVPDYEKEVQDGYKFVECDAKAYRGKYVMGEFGEQYIDMISGWYRVGEQKVTGGYEFCPLIMDGYSDFEVDRQGGACDNDVHEIFKCIEETVLRKAYIYEEENGNVLAFGCKVKVDGDRLIVELPKRTENVIYNLKNGYRMNEGSMKLEGFGEMRIAN